MCVSRHFPSNQARCNSLISGFFKYLCFHKILRRIHWLGHFDHSWLFYFRPMTFIKSEANSVTIHLPPRRISTSPTSSVLYTMRTRIITTAGIAFCSLFIPAITTVGDTVLVPASRTTVITEVPAPPTVNTVVRALDNNRYQLIQKKDNKEVYRDTQTGEKWILEIHHRNG
jgi:hypothetical protein